MDRLHPSGKGLCSKQGAVDDNTRCSVHHVTIVLFVASSATERIRDLHEQLEGNQVRVWLEGRRVSLTLQDVVCRSKDDLLSPAKTWEQSGDYKRAIDAYLKITVQQNSDYDFLVTCWDKVSIHTNRRSFNVQCMWYVPHCLVVLSTVTLLVSFIIIGSFLKYLSLSCQALRLAEDCRCLQDSG